MFADMNSCGHLFPFLLDVYPGGEFTGPEMILCLMLTSCQTGRSPEWAQRLRSPSSVRGAGALPSACY